MAKEPCHTKCFAFASVMFFQFWRVVPLLALLVAQANIRNLLLSPAIVKRTNNWAASAAWQKTDCEVIAAGMANRGVCQMSVSPIAGAMWSECPGYEWCAAEGSVCKCVGDVMFAAGRFPTHFGTIGEMPDNLPGHFSVKKGVQGEVPCQVSSFGDPSPYNYKACYCLRKQIADLTRAHSVDAARCSSASNEEYWGNQPHDALLAEGEKEEEEELEVDLKEHDEIDEDEVGTDETANPISSIELPNGWESRRRGGCRSTYLPWALVKVSDSSEHAGGKFRCAYEYGADAVSRESDRTFAAEAYSRMNNSVGTSRACDVRSDCSVALQPLGDLANDHERHGQQLVFSIMVCLSVALGMSLCSGFFGLCGFDGFSSLDFLVVTIFGLLLCTITAFIDWLWETTPHKSWTNLETWLLCVFLNCVVGLLLPAGIIAIAGIQNKRVVQPTALTVRVMSSSSFTQTMAHGVLRRTNSALRQPLLATAPAVGARVEVIASGETGYVAGVSGDTVTLQSDDGDMKEIVASGVRAL